MMGAQFKTDVQSLEDEVARNHGYWTDEPATKTAAAGSKTAAAKAPAIKMSESLVILGQPKHAHA